MTDNATTRRDYLKRGGTVLLTSVLGGCLGGVMGTGDKTDPYQTPTRSPPPEYEPKITKSGNVVFHKGKEKNGNKLILCELPVRNTGPIPTHVTSSVIPQSGEWAENDAVQAVIGPDETKTLNPGVRMLKWGNEVTFKVLLFARLKGDSEEEEEREMEFKETLRFA